jgi:hypothetical protein
VEPSYTCDLGAAVTWARGDRIRVIIPAVATQTGAPLVNRATVTDDQNRNANATATVTADPPVVPPNVSTDPLVASRWASLHAGLLGNARSTATLQTNGRVPGGE